MLSTICCFVYHYNALHKTVTNYFNIINDMIFCVSLRCITQNNKLTIIENTNRIPLQMH